MKRKRIQTEITGKTMTQQHMKEQCDVNSILERYRKTGHINHVRTSPGQYGDFSQYRDFRQSLDLVMDAQDQFNQMPAVLRKRFGNDPSQLLDFLSDPENQQEALKLGLLNAAPQTGAPNDDKTTITQPANPEPAPQA